MVLSLSSAAFAEGETWVPIKTSGDTLEKGDLYVDLASVKDTYIEMTIYQTLCDYVHPKDSNWNAGGDPEGTFNNYSVAACEKLAGLYPALWEAALQESYEADPRWGIDGFYTIQRAWSILFDKVLEAHPELGFTTWSSLSPYGYDYICEEYPDALTQATADAVADFTAYENADWFYDSSFTTRWYWLKAELDGDELPMVPEEIKETFTEYGVEWQPVAADIASVTGEGGYYLNGNGIDVTLSEEEKANIRERSEWMFEMYQNDLPTTIRISDDESVEVSTEEELRTAINTIIEAQIAEQEAQMAEYYANFFDGATLLVNPDENSMFQISFTKTYTDYGGSFEQTSFFPFVEKRGASMPVTTKQLWSCVNAYAWTWVDEETAFVTVTTGLGEEIAKVNADVSAETITEPQVGVQGEKLATATAQVNGTDLTSTKSFAIPAINEDPAEDPGEQPAVIKAQNICIYDGKDHGTSFFGWLLSFIHYIIYVIQVLPTYFE